MNDSLRVRVGNMSSAEETTTAPKGQGGEVVEFVEMH